MFLDWRELSTFKSQWEDSHEGTCCTGYPHEVPGIVQFVETESRTVVSGAGGGEELLFNG